MLFEVEIPFLCVMNGSVAKNPLKINTNEDELKNIIIDLLIDFYIEKVDASQESVKSGKALALTLVVGSILIIYIILFLIFYYRKKKKKQPEIESLE